MNGPACNKTSQNHLFLEIHHASAAARPILLYCTLGLEFKKRRPEYGTKNAKPQNVLQNSHWTQKKAIRDVIDR